MLMCRNCTLPSLPTTATCGSFVAEQHGIDRNRHLLRIDVGLEMHFAERAGQQFAVLVGNVDFGQQGSSRGIDGVSRSRHGASKLLAGKFLQGYDRLHPDLEWPARKPAEPTRRRAKDRCARCRTVPGGPSIPTTGVAGIDQRAGIDVAPSDHPIERSVDVLEPFQLLQALDVGIGGGQVRLACS